MQLQQRLNVLKINNVKVEKMKQLQKNEIKKSCFFNVFVNTRRKNSFFQFSTFINLFFIYNIVIITVNDFANNKKKFNKLFSLDKFINKFNYEFTFFD